MKKRKRLTLIIIIIILLSVLAAAVIQFKETNLIKLSYVEIMQKINNKDDFVLCISAKDCIHCQDYIPKLKKISKEYNIKIYYTDISTFTDEEYETFKTDFSFDGGTPITIFIKEGQEKTTATRIEGNTSSDKVINKLKKNGFINE